MSGGEEPPERIAVVGVPQRPARLREDQRLELAIDVPCPSYRYRARSLRPDDLLHIMFAERGSRIS